MNTQHFKELLLNKENELQAQIAILSDETRGNGALEVKDYAESAAVDQGNAQTMESATVLTHTLEAVRGALQRIDEGAYGSCTVCGQKIENARLNAVPWTPYCRRHQEDADKEAADARSAVTREAAAVWRG